MGFFEIFDGYSGDISLVSWRYFIGFFEILDMCPKNICMCPKVIGWLSWNHLISVLEIFYGVVKIFDVCPGDI